MRYTEAWRVYAIALLNVLLSSNHLVHCSCEEVDSGEQCGQWMAPTNKTSKSLQVLNDLILVAYRATINFNCAFLVMDNFYVVPCMEINAFVHADIVDLNSSGCNDTHIWISWSWTTPTGCNVNKVVLNKRYTCFTEVRAINICSR